MTPFSLPPGTNRTTGFHNSSTLAGTSTVIYVLTLYAPHQNCTLLSERDLCAPRMNDSSYSYPIATSPLQDATQESELKQ